MSLYKLLFDNFKRSRYNYKMLFFNCAVICFPLILLINTIFYMQVLTENGYSIGNLNIAVICIGICTFVVAVIVFQYALKAYVKTQAQQYSLLISLGIKIKDLLYILGIEFFLTSILINVVSTIIGEILVSAIYISILQIPVSFIYKNAIKAILITILFFLLISLFSLGLFLFTQRKKGVLCKIEELQYREAKGYHYYIFNYLYIICGLILILISLVLLVKYSVGKMLISLVLNLIGIWLILNTNGNFFRNNIKKIPDLYYKYILEWNDLIFQCKSNSKVIYSIYIISFFSMFLISGLIDSLNSENSTQAFNQDYPYEFVIYGESVEIDIGEQYNAIEIKCDGEKALGISVNTYQNITGKKIDIKKNEIIYISQKTEEPFSPLENKQTVTIDNNNETNSLQVLDSKWEILFGKSLNNLLENIVIFNDEQFDDLSRDNKVNQLVLVKENNMINAEKNRELHFKSYINIWQKDNIIKGYIAENKIISLLIYVIAIVFVLEQESIIFLKRFSNWNLEKYEYSLLNDLGISKKRINKLVAKKIKNIMIIPCWLATIMSLIYLLSDGIYQGQKVYEMIGYWGIYAVVFLLTQYVGYLFAKHEFQKFIWCNILKN